MFLWEGGLNFFHWGGVKLLIDRTCDLYRTPVPPPPSRSAHYHKFYSTMVILFFFGLFIFVFHHHTYYRYMFYSNLKVGCDGVLIS